MEAKLVAGDMVISIATEFIENEDENVTKQDCEINAFKRLAEKLKHKYPRLPICIAYMLVSQCLRYVQTTSGNNQYYIRENKYMMISF